jgi:hypothetical protein
MTTSFRRMSGRAISCDTGARESLGLRSVESCAYVGCGRPRRAYANLQMRQRVRGRTDRGKSNASAVAARTRLSLSPFAAVSTLLLCRDLSSAAGCPEGGAAKRLISSVLVPSNDPRRSEADRRSRDAVVGAADTFSWRKLQPHLLSSERWEHRDYRASASVAITSGPGRLLDLFRPIKNVVDQTKVKITRAAQ